MQIKLKLNKNFSKDNLRRVLLQNTSLLIQRRADSIKFGNCSSFWLF